MKDRLLELIGQIDTVKSHFKISGASTRGFPTTSTIYNTPEFAEWSQALQFELQEIFDRTHDKFIWSSLVIIEQGFNGWKDKKSFADLSGKLHAIQENIDKYYPAETSENSYMMEVETTKMKTPKIFIVRTALQSFENGGIKNVAQNYKLFRGAGHAAAQGGAVLSH